MTHDVAIVEEEPGKAVGISFPDLPGCFSAVDTDEALLNAGEAVAIWADVLAKNARSMPRARTLTELKTDPDAAAELHTFIVALIPFEPVPRAAAK